MAGDERSGVVDDSHLDIDLEFPDQVVEASFPDVYVGLEAGLLAPGDGIVTDRHHASSGRYEPDDPQNQIGGQIVAFAPSGWLRHGCERVLQVAGVSACHPGEPSAEYMLEDVYERDLDAGYHEKGSCVEGGGVEGVGCVVHELFGGFDGPEGKLLRRSIPFSPIRREVDVTEGEVEGHYRQLNTQVRSRNAEDGGQPLRHSTRDVVGNVVGTWRVTLHELKPEFVGLLVEAVDYLDAHSDEHAMQLGGARNFGAGMVDCGVVNPLYTESELRRKYNRAKDATNAMRTKDDVWREQCRDEFVRALQARIAARGDGDVPMPGGDA